MNTLNVRQYSIVIDTVLVYMECYQITTIPFIMNFVHLLIDLTLACIGQSLIISLSFTGHKGIYTHWRQRLYCRL